MKETQCVHVCDQCGKTHVETKTGNWIRGWYSVTTHLAYFYGSNTQPNDFCSLDCLIKWVKKSDVKKI